MSAQKVREYLKQYGRDGDIIEFGMSSATVLLAASAIGCEPAHIAKTISLKNGDGCILIVASGDVKIDNSKFKSQFGMKASMLSHEETARLTGFAVGGVCPFGVDVPVYLDRSLQRFEKVFPAGGSSNSVIELTISELEEYSRSLGWVDVCKNAV